VLGIPGKQPSLHIRVFDVMARLHLALAPLRFGEESLLVGDVRFDGVGN
jgi:hypothetical protein